MHSILLVDDDRSLREIIRMNLESAGYSVISAAGGAEAKKILGRERVDILVTDILMPNGDGLDLIRAVRKTSPGLRIIAMSGGDKTGADLYLRFARGFRADGLLQKPFRIEELLLMLNNLPPKNGVHRMDP